jgi:hypothetical protein
MQEIIVVGLWLVACAFAIGFFVYANKEPATVEFKFVQPVEEEESELGRLESAHTATQLEWDALTK